MSRLSRRSLLGLGALAGAGTVVGAAAPVAGAAVPTSGAFVLHGRSMRRLTGSGASAVGDVHSVRGDLASTAAGD